MHGTYMKTAGDIECRILQLRSSGIRRRVICYVRIKTIEVMLPKLKECHPRCSCRNYIQVYGRLVNNTASWYKECIF